MMGSDQCLYSNISIIVDLLCRYILRVTSCIVRSDIIFCTGSCIIFSCISESFSRDKDLSDDGANLLLFSTTCMFTDLCWDVLWNCRTSSDLNGNSDLLSVQYPSSRQMNQLASGSAHGKVYSLIAARAIDNKDLLLYFVVFCLVTALVTAIRKRGAAHGWNISILAGGVVYLICMFIGGYLVNNEINITSQIGTIIGSIAIALIIQFLYNVIDYTREETFEFEDEEYYYYVRAIPKVTVEEEEFNVTQITVPSHRFSLKEKNINKNIKNRTKKRERKFE